MNKNKVVQFPTPGISKTTSDIISSVLDKIEDNIAPVVEYEPTGIQPVQSSDPVEYKERVDILIAKGYKIMSTACQIVDKVSGYKAPLYVAILVKDEDYLLSDEC